MQKAERIVFQLCRFGVGFSFLILIVAVLIQVVGRTFNSSPIWTEELTRYAMLYLVAFGAGLSLRSGDLVNVDVLCDSLRAPWPWRLRLVSAFSTALLSAILILPAWKFVSIGAMQTSPAILVRMDFIHFSIVALLVVLFLFSAFRVYRMVFLGEDGLADPREEVN